MEALVLSCTAIRGATSLEFSWYKDGELATRRALPQMLSDTVSTLTIAKVGAEDLGNYTCRASNAVGSDSYTAALTVADEPKIQPFYFPKNHPLNKKVVVSCVAMEGDEPLSFAWLKDGRSLVSGQRVFVTKFTENIASLTISEVTAEDIGNYTCLVSNKAGKDSYTSSLIVNDVPRIQPFNFPKNEHMPRKVVVHCVVLEGREPFKFTWLKDGVTLVSGRKLQVKILSEALSSLTVLDVGAEDIGNYTCTVSNTAGSDRFTSELLITAVPKIQPFSFPSNPPLGKDVAVFCFVTEGQQPLTFQWFRNDRRINANDKLTIEQVSGKMASLAVHEISAEDIGNYTCRVSNAAGRDAFTSELVVTDLPRLQPFSFPRHEQMPKKVIVHCAVLEGSEPFAFSWLKDGNILANSKRLQVKVSEAMSLLTIVDLNAEDIGNYTCVVTNAAGSDSFTSQLLVTAFLAIFTVCTGTEAPRLQPFYFPKEHPLTETLVVSCFASRGTQPLVFSWFKDGRPVDSTLGVVSKKLTDTISTLTISRVGAEHLGNYTCRAANEAGHDSYTAALVVSEPPRVQQFSFPKNPAMKTKVVVSCVATGDEPLSFSWSREGRPLTAGQRITVSVHSANVASLTISQVTAEDVGNYTCVVSNRAGKDSFTSSLVINGQLRISLLAT
ncbi:hypothetical protein ISCGN_024118 [Ixodes scapularis]